MLPRFAGQLAYCNTASGVLERVWKTLTPDADY